jgi:hypothetical protein
MDTRSMKINYLYIYKRQARQHNLLGVTMQQKGDLFIVMVSERSQVQETQALGFSTCKVKGQAKSNDSIKNAW